MLSQIQNISPKRIVIVGFPGSGKSTLGRDLAEKFSLPQIETDKLFWKNKTEHVTEAELKSLVDLKIKQHEEWILEGHFKTLHQLILPHATVVIEINKSFMSSFLQYSIRELKRSDVNLLHKLKQISFVPKNYRRIIKTRRKALENYKGVKIGLE